MDPNANNIDWLNEALVDAFFRLKKAKTPEERKAICDEIDTLYKWRLEEYELDHKIEDDEAKNALKSDEIKTSRFKIVADTVSDSVGKVSLGWTIGAILKHDETGVLPTAARLLLGFFKFKK